MTDFVFFLGRFHVLVLHLPIGIILATVLLEFLARSDRYRYLAGAGPFLWCAVALSSIVTVILGYFHFAEGGFDSDAGSAHRLYGTSLAVVTVLIWWLRAKADRIYGRIQPIAGVLVVGLVAVTGHYGGMLTHGSSYLLAYAPQALRALAGLDERRPPVVALGLADPYLDIVQPMLGERCASCHGGEKRNGEFSMETYESTLAGGETGTAVVPGNATASELYRRVSLPPGHDAFMPAEGRTALTVGEVSILRWWIDAGAPRRTTLEALGYPPDLGEYLAEAAGLPGHAGVASGAASASDADPALVDSLRSAGFVVRALSRDDRRLSVSVGSPGSGLAPEALQLLADASEATVELNLQDSGLVDRDLEIVGRFTELSRLRLSNNAITNAGIPALAGMQRLEHLNLYGNPGVTDASAAALAKLPKLADLFIWQTGISDRGIAELRRLRPELSVQGASGLATED